MTAASMPCMTCMPRMLSSLTRTQGTRPAVASLSSKAGNLQPRYLSVSSDKRKWTEPQTQICGLSTSNFATAAKRGDLCSGPKAGLAAPDVARKPGAWIGSGLPIEGKGAVSTGSVQGARTFATLDSARYENSQVGVQVGFCTNIEGAQSRPRHGPSRVGRDWRNTQQQQQQQRPQQQQQQQRRMYSSKDGFGGGQHFPHSDQDSLGLFGGGSRRVVKPERIIIVRHGESLGNLDESTYVHVPDWKIPLTKKGFKDGQRAGEKIKEYIGDKPLFIYTSPYLRTKQTLAGMVEAFDTNYIVGVREEPRLTEQQFGNFQNLATIVNSKAERARFGRFYYRFPQGESGLDVYNRATSFIATMFRDFANENIARDDLNVIIVTHGLTLRLLVMRWFQYSIADFEETLNPANGGFVVMERRVKEDTDSRFFGEQNAERRDLRHWYELTPESRAHINFREQRQFGSLWKLLSELPDEPGVLPEEYINKKPEEPRKKK